jgi:hypothetical protein
LTQPFELPSEGVIVNPLAKLLEGPRYIAKALTPVANENKELPAPNIFSVLVLIGL